MAIKRTMDDVEMVNDGCPEQLIGKHMGGVPVESLPPTMWRVLTAAHTDEGITAAKAGAGVGIVTGSDLEKKTKLWGDALKTGTDVLGALDPMRDLVNRANIPAGMTPKLLSAAKIAKHGTPYAVAVDAKGDPVKGGDLVVGYMPTPLVERNRKILADKAKDAMKSRFQTNADMAAKAETGGKEVYGPTESDTLEDLSISGVSRGQDGILMDYEDKR